LCGLLVEAVAVALFVHDQALRHALIEAAGVHRTTCSLPRFAVLDASLLELRIVDRPATCGVCARRTGRAA
jgi:uncharacterized lipoprotein YbaY